MCFCSQINDKKSISRVRSPRKSEIEVSQFIEQCFQAHNDYRMKHKVPPLVLSKKVSAEFRRWKAHKRFQKLVVDCRHCWTKSCTNRKIIAYLTTPWNGATVTVDFDGEGYAVLAGIDNLWKDVFNVYLLLKLFLKGSLLIPLLGA